MSHFQSYEYVLSVVQHHNGMSNFKENEIIRCVRLKSNKSVNGAIKKLCQVEWQHTNVTLQHTKVTFPILSSLPVQYCRSEWKQRRSWHLHCQHRSRDATGWELRLKLAASSLQQPGCYENLIIKKTKQSLLHKY